MGALIRQWLRGPHLTSFYVSSVQHPYRNVLLYCLLPTICGRVSLISSAFLFSCRRASLMTLCSQTCRWAHGTIRAYQAMYSQKVLSAFGLHVRRIVNQDRGSTGIPSSVGGQVAVLSCLNDMTSLVDVHISSWTAARGAPIVACDGALLAQMQVTWPPRADMTTSAIRFCHVPDIPGGIGRISPSSWIMEVDSSRPLGMALSAHLDMLVLLCIRDE